MNKSYSKIRHIQESNLRLEKRLMNEQSLSSVMTPEQVEKYFRKNIKNVMGVWTTLDDLKKLYSVLLPLSGKMVKGISKCFDESWQTAGKPIQTTVLNYVNQLNYWVIQDKCDEDPSQGPSYQALFDEIRSVGTKTLGKEGEMIKNQLLDLAKKNGVKPIE